MWPGVPLLCCPDPHQCSQVGIKTPLLAGMGHDIPCKQDETDEDAYGHRYRECRGNPSPGDEQGYRAQQPDQQAHGKGDKKGSRGFYHQTADSKPDGTEDQRSKGQ